MRILVFWDNYCIAGTYRKGLPVDRKDDKPLVKRAVQDTVLKLWQQDTTLYSVTAMKTQLRCAFLLPQRFLHSTSQHHQPSPPSHLNVLEAKFLYTLSQLILSQSTVNRINAFRSEK